jgi:hypothetical protein
MRNGGVVLVEPSSRTCQEDQGELRSSKAQTHNDNASSLQASSGAVVLEDKVTESGEASSLRSLRIAGDTVQQQGARVEGIKPSSLSLPSVNVQPPAENGSMSTPSPVVFNLLSPQSTASSLQDSGIANSDGEFAATPGSHDDSESVDTLIDDGRTLPSVTHQKPNTESGGNLPSERTMPSDEVSTSDRTASAGGALEQSEKGPMVDKGEGQDLPGGVQGDLDLEGKNTDADTQSQSVIKGEESGGGGVAEEGREETTGRSSRALSMEEMRDKLKKSEYWRLRERVCKGRLSMGA